jgi:adenine phosphoribosyltransferase
MTDWPPTWTARLGSTAVELPLVTMPNGQRIYAFDLMGKTAWNEVAAQLLAERVQASGVPFDILLTAEAKAIALTQALAVRLGQVDYVVARKSLKVYMTDPVEIAVRSITTAAPQKFYLSRERCDMLRGRRVCVVDDVVSTGGTMGAFVDLAARIGFQIVIVACALTEGVERAEFAGVPLINLDHIPFPGAA